MGNPNVTLNLGLLMTKELNYKGSFRYGVRSRFSSCAPQLHLIYFLLSLAIILLPFLWSLTERLISSHWSLTGMALSSIVLMATQSNHL